MSRPPVRSLIVALMVGAAATASSAVWADPPEHPLRRGAGALQFKVDLFGADETLALSMKRHFTDRSALGLQFQFSRNSFDEASSDVGGFFEQGESHAGLESDRHSFAIVAPYFFYPSPRPGVNIFLDAGPLVRWSDSGETRARVSIVEPDTALSITVSENNSWSAGALAEVGFEWFFNQRLSLVSSHGVVISYSQGDSDRREDRYSTEDPPATSTFRTANSSFSVRTTGSHFGFSVYF